jgi:uncharacterized protein (DUF2336 family)
VLPEASALSAAGGVLDDLERAVAANDIRRQSHLMRHLTDLFVAGSSAGRTQHAALFDQVMSRLVRVIDETVRAELSRQLAALPDAPADTLHALALDEAIAVAAPILTGASGLRDATLVESAGTGSQGHLLAISRRTRIPRIVTDIIITRGNRDVVLSTAGNPGAELSDGSAAGLSERALDDPDLACRLWARSDLPRQHLLALFERASAQVMSRLIETDGSKVELYREMVDHAANRLREAARKGSPTYAAALAEVTALQAAGNLNAAQLRRYAGAKRFDEVLVALSIICDLPVDVVEQAMAGRRIDQLLVLARAAELGWETVRPILAMLGAPESPSQREIFARLQHKTARTALQYYRLRSKAAQGTG